MSQVFISYSRLDIEFVEQLVADLRASGFNVWYDLSGLEGGTQWGSEIQKAIEKSQFFALILSPNSLKSKWVQREFLFAEQCNIKVIPIQYQPCSLPMWLMDLQLIDMQGKSYKPGFQKLLKALELKPLPLETGVEKEEQKARQDAEEKERQEKVRLQKEEDQKRRQAQKEDDKARLEKQTREQQALRDKQKQEKDQRQAEKKVQRQAAWLKWKPMMPKIIIGTVIGIFLIAAGFLAPKYLQSAQAVIQPSASLSTANIPEPTSTEKPPNTAEASTPLPTATMRPSQTVTPLPSWVADFVDPILNAIADRTPDLVDDFSTIQPYWNTHLYYEGNKTCPNSLATIRDGRLELKADVFCYAMAELGGSYFSNFVINVEIDVSQLGQGYKASISVGDNDEFHIYWDGSWETIECIVNQCETIDGGNARVFTHSQPNKVRFISLGTRNAIFLNGIPLVFYEHGAPLSNKWLRLDVTGDWNTSDNTAYFDNLEIWYLDQIPGLESLVN